MQSVHRSLYHMQCKSGQKSAAMAHFTAAMNAIQHRLTNDDLLTATLFHWKSYFFVYYESLQRAIAPEELFGQMTDLLESWPSAAVKRTFVPMIDIFHCQEPVDSEQWRRKQPIDRVQGRITRLKPEMVSSYIFYHYQLQEEKPGSFDKHCLIAMQENLLFFYQELPAVVETPPRPGKLCTKNTPDDWHGTMFPHFILWDDAPPGEEIWRQVEVLFHLG
jgi:hypothetical protein